MLVTSIAIFFRSRKLSPLKKNLPSVLAAAFCLFTTNSFCQKTPEFTKGFVGYLGLQQGVVSNFNSSADNYQIGFTLNPQYTIVPTLLRIGVQGGEIYALKQWNLQGGPTINLRLFDVKTKSFGSLLNVQLMGSYLWGAHNEKLVGGGLQAEFFQLASLSFTGHRDYGNNLWWLQSTISYNIFKPKKQSNDPFKQL